MPEPLPRQQIWHLTGRRLGAYRFAYDEAGVASLDELHADGWKPITFSNLGGVVSDADILGVMASPPGMATIVDGIESPEGTAAVVEAIGTPEGGAAIAGTEALWLGGVTGELPRPLQNRTADRVSVLDFGAVGDGVTDDRAAIQAAIDYVESVGGEVFVPRRDYALGSYVDYGNSLYGQLTIKASNVRIRFEPGARFVNTYQGTNSTSVRGLLIFGHGAMGPLTGWIDNETLDATVYVPTAPLVKGATSIPLTPGQEANFAAGDWIFVRTGQTLTTGAREPDAELTQVKSVASGVLTLKWPLCKPYAQEYFIAGTAGRTSTTVTANPAVFGVSKVTDRLIHNIELDGLEWVDPYGQQVLNLWQAVDVRLIRPRITFGYLGLGSRDAAFVHVVDGRWEHTARVSAAVYAIAPSTGCSRWQIARNFVRSPTCAIVHLHEGVAASQVHDNNLVHGDGTPSTSSPIDIRGRAYDLSVRNNLISYGSSGAITQNCIFVDSDCVGDPTAVIDGNIMVLTNATGSVRSDGSGVFLGHNPASGLGTAVSMRGLQLAAPRGHGGQILTLSGALTFAKPTCILGTLPQWAQVLRVNVDVTTGFSDTGTDLLKVGHATDDDAYVTALDVSVAGAFLVQKGAVGAGVSIGRAETSAARTVSAVYTAQNAAAAAGVAVVTLEYTIGARIT